MDFALNEEQRGWQMKAREFALGEIRPISLERDRMEDAAAPWDWDIIRKGSKLGFRTLAVPRDWGGPGADFVTQGLVMSELARGDSAMSKAFSQNWKWSHQIAEFCSIEQKQRFLEPFLADDTFVIGSASTEPNAGSDNRYPPLDDPRAGFRLRAQRRGDEWLLNGEKTFIANGPVGKLFFVSARTNPAVPMREGTTIFLVPRDTPGLRVGKVFNKSGWRFYQNAELVFDDARVPHANVVGAIDGGMKVRSGAAAEFGDFELAANALGVCDAACEHALGFARARRAGGRLLADQQRVQLELGEMHMLTEALRSYVMRTAWEMDHKRQGVNAVLAMNYSCEVIQRVTHLNLAIHGAAGGQIDAMADKLVRDAIIWTHLAGDNTQRLKALRRFPQAPARTG
ncbi:MAG TPA: acyl-CoA dehydrogenase family protein [Burkholderiales bacterium]|nr:acyl-CoA dehydrogenase family protein [Burkholderiales bacterium]